MEPTQTPPNESADSSAPQPGSPFDSSFLEQPTCDLIQKPLDAWTDDELLALVAYQRELTNVPGRMRVLLRDESVEIKTGKRPSRSKKDMKTLCADLL